MTLALPLLFTQSCAPTAARCPLQLPAIEKSASSVLCPFPEGDSLSCNWPLAVSGPVHEELIFSLPLPLFFFLQPTSQKN